MDYISVFGFFAITVLCCYIWFALVVLTCFIVRLLAFVFLIGLLVLEAGIEFGFCLVCLADLFLSWAARPALGFDAGVWFRGGLFGFALLVGLFCCVCHPWFTSLIVLCFVVLLGFCVCF